MKRAFTIVEALVAMALLGTVMLSLLSLYPRSLLREKQLQNRCAAVAHAEAQLALPHDLLAGTYPLPDSTLPDGTALHGVLEVTPVAPFEPQELRQLTVTVKWDERGRSQVVRRRIRVGNATH